jgi:hypothetical protein
MEFNKDTHKLTVPPELMKLNETTDFDSNDRRYIYDVSGKVLASYDRQGQLHIPKRNGDEFIVTPGGQVSFTPRKTATGQLPRVEIGGD